MLEGEVKEIKYSFHLKKKNLEEKSLRLGDRFTVIKSEYAKKKASPMMVFHSKFHLGYRCGFGCIDRILSRHKVSVKIAKSVI